MKLIIAGSRYFYDYELLKATLDAYLINTTVTEVVSGRCDRGMHTFTTEDGVKVYGADGLGERYAKEKGYPVTPFPADWKSFGTKAGPIRNEQMAKYGTALVAFWNDQKGGTKSMIELAEKYKLPTRVKLIRP